MPKNEGGGDKKSKHYKDSKITGVKIEPVITPTYTDLGIDRKDASQWQFMAEHEDKINAMVSEKHKEAFENGS